MTDPSIIRFREREQRERRERARLEEQRRKPQPRAPQSHESERVARLELGWPELSRAGVQAQQIQVSQALLQNHARVMAEIETYFRPPAPPPEPDIMYVEAEQGSARLGYSDFDPKLAGQ